MAWGATGWANTGIFAKSGGVTGGTPTPAPGEDARYLASSTEMLSGGQLPVGSGNTVSYTKTYWNESGAPITKLSAAIVGWVSTNHSAYPGARSVGNHTLTATYSYLGSAPQNFTVGGSPTISTTPGTHQFTDEITLATPIPTGAGVTVTVTGTIPNGVEYAGDTGGQNNMLGFAGLMTTAPSNTIQRPLGYGGDSIFNTPSLWTPIEVVAQKRFGSVNLALGGSRWATWAGTGTGTPSQATVDATVATRFGPQANFLQAVGVQQFIGEWGVNDTTDGNTADNQLKGYYALETLLATKGINFWQTTESGRSQTNNITATSVTVGSNANGATLEVVVPNATGFRVGDIATFSGSSQATVNGLKVIEAVNTATNTLTFAFYNSAGLSGTISGTTILSNAGYPLTPALMAPIPAREAIIVPKSAAIRSRSWTGGFIEVNARTSQGADSGLIATSGSQPEFPSNPLLTAQSGTSASQFIVSQAEFVMRMDYTPTPPSGAAIAFITGPARGIVQPLSNNTTGEIQALLYSSTPAATPVAGNLAYLITGSYYSTLADIVHPAGQSATAESNGAGIWKNVIIDALVNKLGRPAIVGYQDTPGTLFRDEFNRPEEPLGASSDWTVVSGQSRYARVFNRGLYSTWNSASNTRAVFHSPNMGSADHWVEIVYRNAAGNDFSVNNIVGLRVTDSSNFLGFNIASATLINIVKRVANTQTTIATVTLASALKRGDRIRVGIKGSDMTVWVNDVVQTPSASLTGLTGLPASTTRQGLVVGGGRREIAFRYATGLMP